jgi:membrane protein
MHLQKWAGVFRNVVSDVDRNHTLAFAAGLSYYFVLSVFPALIAISAVVGFFPAYDVLPRLMNLAYQHLPAGGTELVRKAFFTVVSPHRGALLSIGLIGTLWSASSGFAGMIEALNIAYDVEETRPFWKTRALALLMTFLVGGLLMASLGTMLVGPELGKWLDARHWYLTAYIWTMLQWILAVICVVAAVECTYFLGPNMKQRIGHTLLGSVFAVALWLVLSYGLRVYFAKFAHLNYTYGSLGGVIAMMLWLYWSFFVILLGAEINGELIKASRDGTAPPSQQPPETRQKPPAERDHAA